jgi:molecular chaperone GrpE
MSTDAKTDAHDASPDAGAATDDRAAGDPAGAAAGGELDALKKERDELFDRLARVSAEFQNFQKRTQRDRAKWTQDAVRDVLGGLLAVFDAIDLAIGSIERGADAASVRQGVELVRDELRRQLGNQGVVAMEVHKGTPFDPERHQAISVEEVPGLERDEVSFVARAGYMIGDVVMRPAQVGVRKAVPKA